MTPVAGGIRSPRSSCSLRRRAAGGAGGVSVPARMAGDAGVGRGAAAVGDPGVHRHVPTWGFRSTSSYAAGAVAGGRHSGGRRHRGGGEHRAPPAHGQDALSGGDGGGRRDRPAVIATTTLIAVFLPTASRAASRQVLQAVRLDAALAVFASLVVARMLTPMMAAYMMKPMVAAHREPKWLEIYMRWAAWCLRHRWVTLVAAGAFFVGSMLIPLLPTGFHSAGRQLADPGLPRTGAGSTLADTKAAAEKARQLVMAKCRIVKSVYTTIGGGSAAPIRSRRRAGGGAQGDADHPAHRAFCSDRSASRPIEDQHPQGVWKGARRAQQGGPGRLRREIHPGAHRR